MMDRRGLLRGLAGVVCAPAIIRVATLMPIKPLLTPMEQYCLSDVELMVAFQKNWARSVGMALARANEIHYLQWPHHDNA